MCTSEKGVTDGSIDSVQHPKVYVVNCRTLNSFVTILLAFVMWIVKVCCCLVKMSVHSGAKYPSSSPL